MIRFGYSGLILCVCVALGGRPARMAAQEAPRLQIGLWSIHYDTKALTVLTIEESKPPNSFTPFTIALRNDSGRVVTAFFLYASEDRECRTQAHFKPAGPPGWLRRGEARSPRETAGGCTPPRDRSGAGLATGPLGPVGDGSAKNAPGTPSSWRRFRVPDRGAGSNES
jgi:hypothetical protein